MTATFFNADYLVKQLPKGARVMLSGEVSYFRQVMQLTHPEFLVLDGSGQGKGSKSLAKIAEGAGDEAELLAAFERDYFPIYAASAKVQSWDIFACVRQVLAVLDPVEDPLPESFGAWNLCSEDEALRAIHLAERVEDRDRPGQAAFDEAVGLQWRCRAQVRRACDTGPPAPWRNDGLAAALRSALPFELTQGQTDVLDVLTAELASTRPMHRMLQGEVGSGKTIVSVLAMFRWSTPDTNAPCWPDEVLAAQHARSIRDVLGPLGMAGELGGADGPPGWLCSPDR